MSHESVQALMSAEVSFSGVANPKKHDAPDSLSPMDMVFFGFLGECAGNYSAPAALQLKREGSLKRIAGIDLRLPPETIPFDDYFANGELAVTMHWLEDNGYLNPQTRHIVSTPTPTHVPIITALLNAGCRDVASEKPLTLISADAHALLGKNVHQISHQLAKTQMRKFIQECRAGLIPLEQIGHFDFFLLEDVGVTPGRAVDNVICDMHWHGYEAMVVPLASLVEPEQSFRMVIDEVVVAKYIGGPAIFAPARDWTLAAIKGRILGTHEITYRILAGKGWAHRDKRFVVKDRQGCELRSIPLVEEPRWRAHYRLLRELTKPVPDMLTTLEQAVGVVDLCQHSVQMAVEVETYPFGSMPFLEPLA